MDANGFHLWEVVAMVLGGTFACIVLTAFFSIAAEDKRWKMQKPTQVPPPPPMPEPDADYYADFIKQREVRLQGEQHD